MTEQAFFTLGEAAKVTGKSKGTLSNAIKAGRLSVYEKTEHGYRIDAAELFRVFPPNTPNGSGNGVTEQSRTLELNSSNKVLEREIEILRQERDRERRQMQDTIDDLRSRLDREEEERKRVTRILTDQSEKKAQPEIAVSAPYPLPEPETAMSTAPVPSAAPRRGWRGWFGRAGGQGA
jgi:hypothetical protein